MILSIFLLAFFGFVTLFGYLMLRSHRKLQRIGIVTQATVVGVEKRVSADSQGSRTSYYPKLEFITKSGETVVVSSNSGKRKKEAQRMEQEGAQVEIIYDPDKPTTFSVNSSFYEYFPMVMCLIGVIGISTGILGLLGVIYMPEGESTMGF